MFIYRIYISSQIIVTSPDVTPVSLPGFVLLLALYPASCTHTHIHTHLMRMSWKSTAYWYEIIYTVHLVSNIPILRQGIWLVELHRHHMRIYYYSYIRDFTNVTCLFLKCVTTFSTQRFLLCCQLHLSKGSQEFHMLWKFLSLGSRRLIFWTSHQFWRRWWRRPASDIWFKAFRLASWGWLKAISK